MKRLISTVLILLLVLSLPVMAMAQEPTAITKGEFVKLMFDKAGTDLGGKTYSDYAAEQGILKGGTDGSLGLDDPLTYRTAGIMLTRFLGLSSLNLHEMSPADEFAYALEYWLLPEDVDMDAPVTAQAAEDLLNSLFAKSESAREYMTTVNNQDINKFRFDATMTIKIQSDGKTTDMPQEMTLKTTTQSEFDMDKGVHQIAVSSGAGTPEVKTEQYILADAIYTKVPEQDGKETWMAIKGMPMPDFKNLAEITPEQTKELDKYTIYRDMGYTFRDGKKVRRIEAFLNIKDMSLVDNVMNIAGMGDTMQGLMQGQNIGDMFDGLYGRMVYYIDPETNLIQEAKMYERVDMAPEFEIMGQPITISSELISGTTKYYDYGSKDIVIELPEDAKNAQVLDITDQIPEKK